METAVEWLWNALLLSGFEEIKNAEGFYHLAKQKEKEQIIKAYNTSWKLRDKPYATAEKYYKQTFKSE